MKVRGRRKRITRDDEKEEDKGGGGEILKAKTEQPRKLGGIKGREEDKEDEVRANMNERREKTE